MRWNTAADWLPPSASDPAAQGGVFLSGLHVPDGASDSGTSGAATRPVPAAASPAGASAPPQRAAATKWGGEVRPAAPGRPNVQPPARSGAVSADGRSPSELTLGAMLTGVVAAVFEKLQNDGAPAAGQRKPHPPKMPPPTGARDWPGHPDLLLIPPGGPRDMPEGLRAHGKGEGPCTRHGLR